MKLEFTKEELDNNNGGGGLEIRVSGFVGNPECPLEGQIFIEYYEGKLRVCTWNGKSDAGVVEIAPEKLEEEETDEEKLEDAHYAYVKEVLGLAKDLKGKFKKECTLPKKIGDWDLKVIDDRYGALMAWVFKGNDDYPVYINPSEMWMECEMNKIGACLMDGCDAHMTDDERTYEVIDYFTWTGREEEDLPNYINWVISQLQKVEDECKGILEVNYD